jgi:serine/threonine protein kinase
MVATPSAPAFDLWAKLAEKEAALLRTRLVDQRFSAGEVFIREGGPGDCLYLVRQGEVEVRRAGQPLARFGVGHVVGEMALLNREPRNADVAAITDCTLSRLAADDFDELCRQLPNLKIILTRLVAHRLSWSGADVLARRIGSYEVVEQLGAGNMGWVFRAVRGPEEFALKMLPHPLVQQPRFLERYRQEAYLLRQLHHENIVNLCDLIELYGTAFLVLEYVRGGNGQEGMIQRGPLKATDVRSVTLAVVRGLQAAHARSVVHCDIKPSNIMISTDGLIKLVDFGIAGSLVDAAAIETGMTPGYAAPERFAGSRGSPEADFYSLGMTVYELLTGQLPFPAETEDAWARVHREETPPPLRERCPNAPPDLEEFVQAAMIKDLRRRRSALQPCLQRWAGDTTRLTVSQPPVPQAQLRPPSYSQAVASAPTITR